MFQKADIKEFYKNTARDGEIAEIRLKVTVTDDSGKTFDTDIQIGAGEIKNRMAAEGIAFKPAAVVEARRKIRKAYLEWAEQNSIPTSTETRLNTATAIQTELGTASITKLD